ncbi:MAG TPA: cupredoxin domain-containing protein [Gaiellaceae bacterium]|nr:cupredoxin domain-containing protein [Gaiellaceae bacterium]
MLRRVIGALGLIAVAGAGLAVGFAQAGTAHPRAANATTNITVAASEFKFVFSKRSIPAVGTVIFTVVNKGKISHNFKIAGKTTPNLLPGKSAKLTVKFTKKGHYAYSCTIPGHAAAGMKGVFSVAMAAVAPPPSSTPTTTTQPTTTTTSTAPVGNAQTTVTVNMVEYAFQLSQSTIPSGQITFVINNKGNEVHNFAILGNRAGAQIAPGTSETWTVSLPAGTYNYQCDVPFHAERGMTGQFTVTP